MIIAHNILAMNTQRELNIANKNKSKSAEKLSSGYRINRAADNAAGLSISEKMRAQIRGLTQGVDNTQDGISLCQVADGALAEVHDMLHRITELSVQAANDTNTTQDRQAIQSEIQNLLNEIDRIGDTTNFNERLIFKGTDIVVKNSDGSSASMGDIPFSDFVITDVSLGKTPIEALSGANMLRLQAIVKNDNSVFNGHPFHLIYGDGTTSSSSFRIRDGAGNETIIQMHNLHATNFNFNGSDTWSREFSYASETGSGVMIKQTIRTQEPSDDEKNYEISYEFSTTGDVANLEFMFHADTAYNNNDRCEGYYINGTRVDNYCIYSQPDTGSVSGSALTENSTSAYVNKTGIPTSLSIVDVDNALSFSEKISFAGGVAPNSLSIGHYSLIDNWDYYNNLNSNLGASTNRADLGFSLYYDLKDLSQGNKISFKYGIVKTESDSNLQNVVIKKDNNAVINHSKELTLWIQSGASSRQGIYLTLEEMNTETLGIRGINVSTVEGAEHSLGSMKHALEKVSALRSSIGAQQNRLEHTIANEENIIENTTVSESHIRDTDMAKEMVTYSKEVILENIGQAMLAQANQSNQYILNLLQ